MQFHPSRSVSKTFATVISQRRTIQHVVDLHMFASTKPYDASFDFNSCKYLIVKWVPTMHVMIM